MGDTQKPKSTRNYGPPRVVTNLHYFRAAQPQDASAHCFSTSQVPKKPQASQSNHLVYYMAKVH